MKSIFYVYGYVFWPENNIVRLFYIIESAYKIKIRK